MPKNKIIASCVGCGCTDNHACWGGCQWYEVNYPAGIGVCSQCDTETNYEKYRQALKDFKEKKCQEKK